MKTIIKIMIWGIVLFGIVFAALAVYISFNGEEILVEQLEARLGMEVELEEVTLKLPLSVNLKKLELSDIAKVKEVSFTPILPGLLSGRIIIDDLRLVEPVIKLIKNSDGSLNFSLPAQETEGAEPPFEVIISGLKVEEGEVSYLDRSVSSDGVKTKLDHLNLDISKTLFPLNRINLKYRLSCEVLDAADLKIGSLSGRGWVNLINKSARGNLLVDNLDIIYFRPYYGDLISKKKLLSASLSLDSQAEAEDNDLEIKSTLLLSNLVYESGAPADDSEVSLDISSIIGKTLDLFMDESGRLELNFTLNTKLDSPRISVNQLKKAIVAAALKNLTGQSPQRIIEKFESIAERFKDFGKQIEGVYKGEDSQE